MNTTPYKPRRATQRVGLGPWIPAFLVICLLAPLLQASAAGSHGASRPTLHVLDLRYAKGLPAARRYDIWHAAACLQGLANRDAPRIFLIYHDGDAPWLERLREPGGLCESWPVTRFSKVEDLIFYFEDRIKGLVLYDADLNSTGSVSSTSLAATTAAACEDALAIRKDASSQSLYSHLVNERKFPVLLDLTGRFSGSGKIWDSPTTSSGSAKCDAYLWALEKYLAAGRCNPAVLSYTLDLWGLKVGTPDDCQLANLDYAVAQRGFCFELSPWGDEAPNDDPAQPIGTDLSVFWRILDEANNQTARQQMIRFCGFTNWQYKYTKYGSNGKHGEVDTEWETVRLLSAYNTYLEGDAPNPNFVSNGSFYAALKPALEERRYVQNPAPTRAKMIQEGLLREDGSVPDGNYILISLGDYDQASWTLYMLAGGRYDDPVRGQLKCNWGIDPNALDRASAAMDYMYRKMSPLDTFTAWDSGAGYVNPSQLHGLREPSGYPSGVEIWRKHCRYYYRFLDYSISAWLLNGSASLTAQDARNYAPFSGDGIGLYAFTTLNPPTLVDNIPAMRWGGDLGSSASNIIDHASGVHFGWYRTILWSPSQVKALQDRYAASRHNHRFLSAYEFYYLLRHHLGGNNHYRATWVSDTIPRIMKRTGSYQAEIVVRNDGWDTWMEANGYRLGHALVAAGTNPGYLDYDSNGRSFLVGSVNPGEITTFTLSIKAPDAVGRFDFYADILREGVTWFREANNIEWKKMVIVAENEEDVDTDGDGVPDGAENARGSLYWHPDDSRSEDGATTKADGVWKLLGWQSGR